MNWWMCLFFFCLLGGPVSILRLVLMLRSPVPTQVSRPSS